MNDDSARFHIFLKTPNDLQIKLIFNALEESMERPDRHVFPSFLRRHIVWVEIQ